MYSGGSAFSSSRYQEATRPRSESALASVGDVGQDPLELILLDPGRQRPPTVAVAEQDDEVGPRRRRWQRAISSGRWPPSLVQAGFFAYPPAQVDRLEAALVRAHNSARRGKT